MAGLGDPVHRRPRREVEAEHVRPRLQAVEADVGQTRRVAVAEAAGLRVAREVPFQRGRAFADEVPAPIVHGVLVRPVALRELLAHARHVQRVRVRGGDEGEAAHARAVQRVARQQRRLGARFLQPLQDGEGLEERRSPLLHHQRRQRARRVHAAIRLLELLALEQVHGHFGRRETLQRQGDPHAAGRERPPEAVEDHWAAWACWALRPGQ